MHKRAEERRSSAGRPSGKVGDGHEGSGRKGGADCDESFNTDPAGLGVLLRDQSGNPRESAAAPTRLGSP